LIRSLVSRLTGSDGKSGAADDNHRRGESAAAKRPARERNSRRGGDSGRRAANGSGSEPRPGGGWSLDDFQVEPREGETRFPDMTHAYDPALIAHAASVADDMGLRIHEGVYASLAGPAYETPAEVRMLRTMGADTVGMSTVPSVTVARNRGMRVLGFSLVTNVAAGLGEGALNHEEVMEEGRKGGAVLGDLIREVVRRWDEAGPAS